jgi:hypothetical protein
MTDEQTAAMAKFIAWALLEGPFDGCYLGGADIQEQAAALGLIVATTYDPKKHGPNDYDIKAGADWYVYAPWLTRAINRAEQVKGSDE